MIIKTLRARNFMSYPTLDVDLSNSGTVLLVGNNKDATAFDSNGAGKSTLLEAVIFALFEKTVRGISKNDVPTNSTEPMYLELKFYVDKDLYTIKRYRNDPSFGNSSYLFKGDTDITPFSVSEVNSFIENLIGVDYKTALSFLVYSVNSFNWADASDTELKTAFEKLFNLSVYTECFEFAKEKLKLLKAEREKTTFAIKTYENEVYSYVNIVKDLTEKQNQWNIDTEKQKQSLDTQIEQETSNIGSYNIELLKIVDKFNKFSSITTDNPDIAYNNAKEKVVNANQEYDIKLQQFNEATAKLRAKSSSLSTEQMEIANQLSLIYNQLKDLDKQLKKLHKHDFTSKICPTCGNEMDKEHQEKHKLEVEDTIQKLSLQSSSLSEKKASLKQRFESITREIQTISNQLEIIDREGSKIAEKKEPLDWIESDYRNVIKLQSSIKSTTKAIQSLVKQKKELDNTENPYTPNLKDYARKLKSLKIKIDSYKAKFKGLEDDIARYTPWQEAFSSKGIKSIISAKMIPALNKQINKYLNVLTDGEIEATFENQKSDGKGNTKDKFNLKILTRGARNYKSCSEGEKKRVNVSICLAINDIISMSSNCQCNIVFWDEILDALDTQGIERVINMIRSISNKESIFVISHNNEIKQYFDNIWTIEKEHGRSKLII